MKQTFILCVLFGVCWPVVSLGAGTQALTIQELVQHIESQYSRTQDFQADFTQHTLIEGFETPLLSSGHFYIKKPGQLRWDYLEPSTEQIYVHDDQVEMFVPDHQQVIKGSLTHMVATQAPLRLLQGVGKLSEHFDVQPTGDHETGEGGLPLLTLIPKGQDGPTASPVLKIISEIQPDTYFIKKISLYETTGNVSTFHFSHLQANQGVESGVFQFDPPEGVVVIEDLLPQ